MLCNTLPTGQAQAACRVERPTGQTPQASIAREINNTRIPAIKTRE